MLIHSGGGLRKKLIIQEESHRFDIYFPIPSAIICGSSLHILSPKLACSTELPPPLISPGIVCMGLYEILHSAAKAAFAAAFLASFFDGPVPSKVFPFAVAIILNRECCDPSEGTQSNLTSLKSS